MFSIGCLIELKFPEVHDILFQTDAESFSFLPWKTKKKSVPKEIGRYQCQNKKALISDPIFSEGFGFLVLRLVCHCE